MHAPATPSPEGSRVPVISVSLNHSRGARCARDLHASSRAAATAVAAGVESLRETEQTEPQRLEGRHGDRRGNCRPRRRAGDSSSP
jgi:hypothetical protein